MSDIDRQNRIIDLSKSGVGVDELAEQFNLSRSGIRRILSEHRKTSEQEAVCTEFLNEIRASGDINRKWDVERWLDCLFLSKRARRTLSDYYGQQNLSEIRITDFMDMIIDPKTTDLESLDTSHPIRALPDIGYMFFREILEKLTMLELGEALDAEWDRRLVIFKRHDLIFQRLFGRFYC